MCCDLMRSYGNWTSTLHEALSIRLLARYDRVKKCEYALPPLTPVRDDSLTPVWLLIVFLTSSWDYNITSKENAELKKKDITNDILAEILEYRHAIARKNRSTCAWVGLVCLRVFTSLFILGMIFHPDVYLSVCKSVFPAC